MPPIKIPHMLIMCEGSADVPYMRALCASMLSIPALSFPYSPKIDHANGGSQWRVVETAANRLRLVRDKKSRALVLIDADRGLSATPERDKAIKIAQTFPSRYGAIDILFTIPCFEGFILNLCGQSTSTYDASTCKKKLAEQCNLIGGNVMFHNTLMPLFNTDILTGGNEAVSSILAWLRN